MRYSTLKADFSMRTARKNSKYYFNNLKKALVESGLSDFEAPKL